MWCGYCCDVDLYCLLYVCAWMCVACLDVMNAVANQGRFRGNLQQCFVPYKSDCTAANKQSCMWIEMPGLGPVCGAVVKTVSYIMGSGTWAWYSRRGPHLLGIALSPVPGQEILERRTETGDWRNSIQRASEPDTASPRLVSAVAQLISAACPRYWRRSFFVAKRNP